MARGWLDKCRHEHKGPCCLGAVSDQEPPRLPTRVVDVVSVPPRIVLSDEVHAGTSRQGHAEYMALSHCWGGQMKTKLTTLAIPAFQRALPPSDELPANFRDAMRVARELGIRYLWIDSLCIVQDSIEDWLHESHTMGDVYSKATVSLLAMAAESSNAGILHAQQTDAASQSVTVMHTGVDDNGHRGPPTPVTFRAWDLQEETLRRLNRYGPLGKRGWTLQELSLSTRILFYGRRRIYWYCHSAGYLSASDVPRSQYYPLESRPLYSGMEKQTGEEILRDYYRLVEEYSERRLTEDSDKLVAIAGVAQRIHETLIKTVSRQTPTYLAGLWSHDLRGLLFCRESDYMAHKVHTRAGAYRAPSWSWAVTDDTIYFVPVVPTPLAIDLELCSWSMVLYDPDNAYGILKDAHIVVRGHVGYLRCTHLPLGSRGPAGQRHTHVGLGMFDELGMDGSLDGNGYFNCATYFFHSICGGDETDKSTFVCTPSRLHAWDEAIDVGQGDLMEETFTVLFVCHGEMQFEGIEADMQMSGTYLHCLILRHVGSGAYERAGYLQFSDGLGPEDIAGWSTETLKLV